MTKIFLYELKRMIFNRFYMGILIISIFFTDQIFSTETIQGIANTAPFSPWSFGALLSSIIPILIISLLFIISLLYSKQEKEFGTLRKATPVNPIHFKLVRYSAIATVFLIITIINVCYALFFYYRYFGFLSFGTLIAPLLTALIPTTLFFFGTGMLLVRFNPYFIYILMAIAIILVFIPLPNFLEIYGYGFFNTYPLSLQGLDPIFQMPTSFLISRILLSIGGLALAIIALYISAEN